MTRDLRALSNIAFSQCLVEMAQACPEEPVHQAIYMMLREGSCQMRAVAGHRETARVLRDLAIEFLSQQRHLPEVVFPDAYRESLTLTAASAQGSPLARVLKRIVVADDTGCWVWTGAHLRSGYGSIGLGNVGGKPRQGVTHHVTFFALNGPMEVGLVTDHLCRNRSCCNPYHLEAVTERVNILRGDGGKHWADKTHCPSGHEYSPENTYRYSWGRVCKTCANSRSTAWQKLKRTGMTNGPA